MINTYDVEPSVLKEMPVNAIFVFGGKNENGIDWHFFQHRGLYIIGIDHLMIGNRFKKSLLMTMTMTVIFKGFHKVFDSKFIMVRTRDILVVQSE